MTTQTYEAPPRRHTVEIPTRQRQVTPAPKREEESKLASFSEVESDPKPLMAFDVPRVPPAVPQTW